ncbi:MAG: hypothetical protein ACK5D5_06310 [Bacteroidota bacterium]|jgi:hypothetical protein
MDHETFFRDRYLTALNLIPLDRKSNWGFLSLQGMIEHMTDSIGIGWKRIHFPVQYSEDIVAKSKTFMLSDKPFKPGTKNSLMSETPHPLRCSDLDAAKRELKLEIENFLEFWKNHPKEKVTNPFFGELNYNEWLHLLHKHAIHHLKQFGLEY